MSTNKQALQARIDEVVADARRLLPQIKLDDLGVRFNLRGKAMGSCHVFRMPAELRTVKGCYLNFNLKAMDIPEAHEHMLKETVAHEIAHLLGWLLDYPVGHGAGWKMIFRMLGGAGARCHSIELPPARRTTKHRYVMPCGQELLLGAAQHGRLLNGTATYQLASTGAAIRPEYYTGKVQA